MSDSDDRDTSTDEESEEDETLANDLVVTKYGMAANIVNAVLKELIEQMKEGEEIGLLCDIGDKKLIELTSKAFKKDKNVKTGIAFPTCISVNSCICHFSPLRSEKAVFLKNKDMVKIDIGAHIDGYIATAAHTVVVGATEEDKVTGRTADVISSAYTAMEAAMRMLRPGQCRNMEITDTIQRISEIFHSKPVENMLSHQLRRNKIDGDKQIIQNPGEKQRSDMEKCHFAMNEVYAIDILMSTGDGKGREQNSRTTVYKKADDVVYSLKLKTSRLLFSDAINKHGSMPFTLRAFEDEARTKLGVVECETHGLFKPYQVLYERENEQVAQFKSTVLIMPNGLSKIAGLPFESHLYSSQCKVEDDKLVKLLATPLKPTKKANKKSKKVREELKNVADVRLKVTDVNLDGQPVEKPIDFP